jgi:hypothetical protein
MIAELVSARRRPWIALLITFDLTLNDRTELRAVATYAELR